MVTNDTTVWVIVCCQLQLFLARGDSKNSTSCLFTRTSHATPFLQGTNTTKEEAQEEGELVEVVPEPTDEELLAQLGLQLEQQMADLTASDELPAGIMRQWAEEELRRDAVQWQPRRELPDQAIHDEEEQDGGDDAGDALEFRNIKGSMLGPCKSSLSLQQLALANLPEMLASWELYHIAWLQYDCSSLRSQTSGVSSHLLT